MLLLGVIALIFSLIFFSCSGVANSFNCLTIRLSLLFRKSLININAALRIMENSSIVVEAFFVFISKSLLTNPVIIASFWLRVSEFSIESF